MFSSTMRPSTWGVGTKITAFTFALVGAILGVLIWMISHTTSGMLQQRNADSVQHDGIVRPQLERLLQGFLRSRQFAREHHEAQPLVPRASI